jgi:hypothetical protein
MLQVEALRRLHQRANMRFLKTLERLDWDRCPDCLVGFPFRTRTRSFVTNDQLENPFSSTFRSSSDSVSEDRTLLSCIHASHTGKRIDKLAGGCYM